MVSSNNQWLLVLLALVLCSHQCVLSGVIEVNLTQIPYNYVAPIWINGSYLPVVVDTGSSALVTYDTYKSYSKADKIITCLGLYIDQTIANFYSPEAVGCESVMETVGLGDIFSNVSIDVAENLYVSNEGLHEWNLTKGDMGLSYNFYCTASHCDLTPFQSILANVTAFLDPLDSSNSTFGLDFRDINSDLVSIAAANSTMQLGGVKPEFADSITWLAQPSATYYHNFMIENLEFCGAALFGNYSTTWEVMVDTGSSCLSLPAEIYDAFVGRFDNNTEVSSLADLPAFTFQLSSETPSQTFYLPLGIFAVDYKAINDELGPLTMNYKGSTIAKKLCILRGSNIESNGAYVSPPPTISFGSLALQSLYFASNFGTVTEGFANKLSASEMEYYADYTTNPSCAAQPICIGDQSYSPGTNTCGDPDCDKYFFVHLDEERHVCVFNPSAVGFGMIFTIVILFMEVVSYMLEQYTGHALAERARRSFGGNQPSLENAFKIDIVTLYLGKAIAAIVDFIIQFSQRLASSNNHGNRRTRLPRDDHADGALRADDI